MNERTRRSLWIFLGVGAFAALSTLIFVGYLTPEMMVYYLSFRWCF